MTKQKQVDTTPFQELLRRFLSTSGVSHAELARQAGISSSAIPKWLAGDYRPSVSSCILLADYFDIYPNTLLEAAGHKPLKFLQREALDPSMVHPDTIAFIEKLEQIHEPYHREILEILGLVADGYVLKLQAEEEGQ